MKDSYTMNNREEVFQFVREFSKEADPTSYIEKLESLPDTRILLVGGSKNGGVWPTISFPTTFEQYPVTFKVEKTYPEEQIVLYGWNLPTILLAELLKRRKI